MKLTCPVCKTVHRISDDRMPRHKATGKCSKCGAPIVFDPELYKADTGQAAQNPMPDGLPGTQVPAETASSPPVPPKPALPSQPVPPDSPTKAPSFWKRNGKGLALAGCLTLLAVILCAQFLLPLFQPAPPPSTAQHAQRNPAPPQIVPKETGQMTSIPKGTGQITLIPKGTGQSVPSRPPAPPNTDPRLEELIKACDTVNLQQVKAILEKHPDLDINKPGRQRLTPLAVASSKGGSDIVDLLLEKGASLTVDHSAMQAMTIACTNGYTGIIASLLKHGANVNERSRSGKTPLHEAADARKIEVMKVLINAGADLKATDSEGSSILMKAAWFASREDFEWLLQIGADPLVRNKQGETVLERVVPRKFPPEILQLLLDRGCDAANIGFNGRTPLMTAVEMGDLTSVEFLLGKKPEAIDIRDKAGRTALFYAARGDKAPVVEYLIKAGASVDIKDARGVTMLSEAKDPKVREILLAHGAERPVVVSSDNFQQVHAIPLDKRFTKGLARAVSRYTQVFAGKLPADNPVQVKVSPVDEGHYKVTLTADLGGKKEDYDLLLSNRASDVRENLGQLEKVLQRFAKARQNPHAAKPKKASDLTAFKQQISERISAFDYNDMLGSLLSIEEQITGGGAGPGLFFSAGEIYSWLALFKNANDNRNLSDLLATEAVCNYLLGGLDEHAEPNRSFYEGLLLLALDCAAAAEEVLDPSRPSEQLLKAYICYDFDQMRALAKYPKVNKRLQEYLLARALRSAGQWNVANEQYVKMLTDYPDFLAATEYVVRNGNVSVGRRYMDGYLEDLMEKHLSLVNDFADTQWMAQDRSLAQEVNKTVTSDKRLEKWFKLHSLIAGQSRKLKSSGGILPGELFSEFLFEDMFNAVLASYSLQEDLLGFHAEATKIYEIARAAYPDRWIAQLLAFKQVRDRKGQAEFLNTLQVEKADGRVLVDVLKNAQPSPRQSIYYLKSHRDRVNPDATGCFQLYERYSALLYRPVAEMYLRNAIALNPYNYRFYEEMLKMGAGEEWIEQGKQHIGDLYGFLSAVAHYYKENGKPDQAILYYEKAIGKAPAQQTAYMELGKIYEVQKQYDKAIETWKGYLKYDTSSLSAVEIENAMGHLWMERGEYDKAYEIYLEGQKSGQARAFLGYAEASEKTGKMLQSEKMYRKAAERYPRGTCAVELGLFYLRQNKPDQAFQAFKEYKRHNWPGFYLEGLIDHYTKEGHPEKVVELVRKMESNDASANYDWMLAVAYSKKNQHKLAAEMMASFVKGAPPGPVSPSAEEYWLSMLKGGLCTPSELELKGIPSQSRDGWSLLFLARFLAKHEHYDESFKVLSQLLQDPALLRNVVYDSCLLQYAIAWSLGSRNQSAKEEILRIMKTDKSAPWTKSRVSFLLGDLDEKALMESCTDENSHGQAQFVVGVRKLRDGDMPAALQYLLMSMENMKEGQESTDAKDVAKKISSL